MIIKTMEDREQKRNKSKQLKVESFYSNQKHGNESLKKNKKLKQNRWNRIKRHI